MKIEYRENLDGSFSLFNVDIADIYFSNIGAHREAIEKFVQPAINNYHFFDTIKILDVCYGMGYNSKSFIDYCLKNNLNYKFEVDAIEIDNDILKIGLLYFDKNISDDVNLIFGKKLLDKNNMTKNSWNISGENCIKYFLPKFKTKYCELFNQKDIDLYQNDILSSALHNIYYQNQIKNEDFLKFNLFEDDLAKILPKIDTKYDLIFHDAFSIRKQPELWNDIIMTSYYNLLKENGLLLTYSKSNVLRKLLSSIGFEVKINYDCNKKDNGTIAIKNNVK